MPAPTLTPPPLAQSTFVSQFLPIWNDNYVAAVSLFWGPTDPVETWPFMLWADTTDDELKQRNEADTAWIVLMKLGVAGGGLLELTGGTLSGALNMDGNAIQNLPLGSGDQPARYTDLGAYVRADGTIDFSALPKIPFDPTDDDHPVRLSYLETRLLAGGSFAGQVIMTTAPTNPLHLTRLTDLENGDQTHGHTGAADGQKLDFLAAVTSGAAADLMLRTTGSGDGLELIGGIRPNMRTEPFQILNQVDTSSGWVTHDLTSQMGSAYMGTGVRGAILLLEQRSEGDNYVTIQFRRQAGDVDQLFAAQTSGGSGIERWSTTVFVPLTAARTFQYNHARVSAGQNPWASLWFLGYM